LSAGIDKPGDIRAATSACGEENLMAAEIEFRHPRYFVAAAVQAGDAVAAEFLGDTGAWRLLTGAASDLG
jgi:hypothetical protein